MFRKEIPVVGHHQSKVTINISTRTSDQQPPAVMCRRLVVPNFSHSDATLPAAFIASELLSYTNTTKKNHSDSSVKMATISWSVNSRHLKTQTNCPQQDLWWTSDPTSDADLMWWLEYHERRGKERIIESEKPSLRSCNRKLVLATICSSTRFFFHLYANPESPHWKTGQVPLMSNLFQSSRVWAWQFTERLEELVITSVTGQLMHITLQHSWRWLSAPQ